DVQYVDTDATKGALITIVNKGRMILPAIVQVTESNGKTGTINLPVEIWQRGGTWTFRYAATTKINKIVLDPMHVLPDIDRRNNEWIAK
ncbi:MAG: M1 family peptidase, partial [Ferruginibacter sp.]|nr:M1 family peptidase [Ferruginibacter sp.]